jgi:hypothetical protein
MNLLLDEVARAGLDLIHHYTMQRERRWRNMLSLSTEKAYQAFLGEHPNVASRITQAASTSPAGLQQRSGAKPASPAHKTGLAHS